MATKAKKKLSNFDFTQKGAAVALVGEFQSGPANGRDTALVMKSAKGMNFSKEGVQKMQEIQVTLPVPEFLEKFFSVWGSDAEVLARLMGYVPEEKEEVEDWSWDKYIEEKLSAFTVVKSLYKSSSLDKDLLALSEEDYIGFLEAQSTLEKAMFDLEKSKLNKEIEMTKPVESVQKSAEVLELEKALDVQKVELQKALDQVKEFQAIAKAAKTAARKAEVLKAVKDEAKVEVLFKALDLVESEEEFTAVVAVLQGMQAAVEKSALFTEQGASGETEEPIKESAVAKALKAQLAKSKTQA